MTQFLVTDENPQGYKLEDILSGIRNDMMVRATKIMEDTRPEARKVLENNLRILQLLTESISVAEDSTRLLNKSFGPHQAGEPRIGTP